MAAPSKTQGTSVLSLQGVAAATTLISSAVDVTTKFAIGVYVHLGRRQTTALTVGAEVRVEASSKSSGDGHWYPIASFATTIVAVESEAVSGTVSSGQKVITVASTTNLTVGTLIYIENSTIGNSEFHRIKSVVSNTSVTVEDDLANAQTSSTIYAGAQNFTAFIDVLPIGRLRVVVSNAGNASQAIAVEALATTADSIT